MNRTYIGSHLYYCFGFRPDQIFRINSRIMSWKPIPFINKSWFLCHAGKHERSAIFGEILGEIKNETNI